MADTKMVMKPAALSAVSKALIDYRTFKLSEIDVSGELSFIGNGRTSGFSETDYAYYSNLSFGENDEVTVTLSGTFFLPPDPPTDPQTGITQEQTKIRACLWSLTGNSTLYLSCSYNHISIYQNTLELARIEVDLEDNTDIITTTKISGNRVTLEVIVNQRAYSTTIVNELVNVAEYSNINVGNVQYGNIYFWDGIIDLSTLRVLNADSVLYSPTTATSLKFTDIVVASSNIELTDHTHSVYGEAYELTISEIRRTNNNICLYAEVSESQYLIINQVGLYCEIDGIRRLFSIASNLQIKKTADIPYDLIFQVFLDVNVVNTAVYPRIEIEDSENITHAEFDDIKLILLNDITDLERAIKLNAKELGFNRPQIFYKSAGKLKTSSETWTDLNRYSKILKALPDKGVENFFIFPYSTLYNYNIKDIADETLTRNIEVENKFFSGPNIVDFSTGSHSLVLHTYLKDLSNKIILSSVLDYNNNQDIYFSLVLLNSNLVFTFYSTEDSTSISVPIVPEFSFEYLCPTIYTIMSEIVDGNINFNLYQKDKLIGSSSISLEDSIDPSNYKIQNYLEGPITRTISQTFNEPYINAGYILTPTIIHFSSKLSPNELRYLSSLFGY